MGDFSDLPQGHIFKRTIKLQHSLRFTFHLSAGEILKVGTSTGCIHPNQLLKISFLSRTAFAPSSPLHELALPPISVPRAGYHSPSSQAFVATTQALCQLLMFSAVCTVDRLRNGAG